MMQVRYASKTSAHRLSNVCAVTLALALAIGASGAIFSFGGFQPLPAFNPDSQLETVAAPANGESISQQSRRQISAQRASARCKDNSAGQASETGNRNRPSKSLPTADADSINNRIEDLELTRWVLRFRKPPLADPFSLPGIGYNLAEEFPAKGGMDSWYLP